MSDARSLVEKNSDSRNDNLEETIDLLAACNLAGESKDSEDKDNNEQNKHQQNGQDDAASRLTSLLDDFDFPLESNGSPADENKFDKAENKQEGVRETPSISSPLSARTPSLAKVISPQKKNNMIKGILKGIENNDEKKPHEILQEIACDLVAFPPGFSEELDSLQLACRKQKRDSIKKGIKGVMRELIDEGFAQNFLSHMREASEATLEEWSPEFLRRLSERLGIQEEGEPLVQAGIKNGKIYWRIVQGNTEVYRRPLRGDFHFDFELEENKTWYMHWQQFRIFKDAGKRSGTVEITQEIFAEVFMEKRCTDSDTLETKEYEKRRGSNFWCLLKKYEILNHRNRISQEWRVMRNEPLRKFIPDLSLCPVIIDTLYSIASNKKYIDPGIPKEFIYYRPERTPKLRTRNLRVKNKEPKKEQNRTRLWDVSTYSDLDAHRNPEEAKKELGEDQILNNDHIPSAAALDVKGKQDENHGKCWAIAVPEVMHNLSDSYKKSAARQKADDRHPFVKDISCYLKFLKILGNEFGYSKTNYLKALGAFRYLYRCQVKEPKKIRGAEVIYSASHLRFFRDPNHLEEIDKLFRERIKHFLGQEEQQTDNTKGVARQLDLELSEVAPACPDSSVSSSSASTLAQSEDASSLSSNVISPPSSSSPEEFSMSASPLNSSTSSSSSSQPSLNSSVKSLSASSSSSSSYPFFNPSPPSPGRQKPSAAPLSPTAPQTPQPRRPGNNGGT